MSKKTETKTENIDENEPIPVTPDEASEIIAKDSITPLEKDRLYEGLVIGLFKLPGKGFQGSDALYFMMREKGNDYDTKHWTIRDFIDKYGTGQIPIMDEVRFKRIDNTIVLME